MKFTIRKCSSKPGYMYFINPFALSQSTTHLISTVSASQHISSHCPMDREDRPVNEKVDGLLTTSGIEIGLVKLSGGPSTNDLPNYIRDHIRGFLHMRDLLN